MSVISNNDMQQEWQALSSNKDVLFYNKKKHRLEGMAYKNGFEKFFKTIWYYMRGYTKNTDTVFNGIESLVSRSIARIGLNEEDNEDSLKGLTTLVTKVHDVTMAKMISQFKKNGKSVKCLAAQQLNAEVEELMRSLTKADTPKAKTPKAETPKAETPKAETKKEERHEASRETTRIEQEGKELTLADLASHVETKPPGLSSAPIPPLKSSDEDSISKVHGAQSAPAMVIPPPFKAPPPPLMLSPEEMKKAQIEKVTKDIKEEEKLVDYLKLAELQKSGIYKKYASAKSNLDVIQSKAKQHENILKTVSIETLKETIADIKKQLKNTDKTSVVIMQNGKPTEYEVSVAMEALGQWQSLIMDIESTRAKLKKYLSLRDEAAERTLVHGEKNFSCAELEAEVAKYESEIPDAIKENKGLKFHESTLFNLNNKLLKLQGEKPIPKKGISKLKKFHTIASLHPKQNAPDKAAVGGLAALAQKIASAKKQAKPDLMKLTSLN